MKFILLHYRNQGVTVLVRESDGMFIGTCVANRATFGENPEEQKMRLFLDHDHALLYLKNQVGPDATFEEREGDSRIVAPPMGMGLPH